MTNRMQNEFANQTLTFETGKLAKQASGAAWVQLGDTVVLAAAVGSKTVKEDQDFFPLSVDFIEKAYSVGRIPGGFFKREGKPNESEILCARLIDRPIRPLFPKEFRNELQIIVYVLSADRENDADVLGITAASLALSLSDLPFEGPIAGVRVGRVLGNFVVNPTHSQRKESDIDLVIAASQDSIIMVEGEAIEVSELDMIAALNFGHAEIKKLIDFQNEFIHGIAKPKMTLEIPLERAPLQMRIQDAVTADLNKALRISQKEIRRNAVEEIQTRLLEQLAEEFPEQESVIKDIIHDIERDLVRKMILDENVRLDGRQPDEIREISVEVGILPRTHGSALFTRGQTQALAVTTLGTKIDEQRIEALEGEFFKNYMLHYNFPPFSTGEVKPLRGTSRREIGHGNLAERSIQPVLPSDKVFPYTIRVVSDVLESNGSSSMATVCAGALSLMDAGVPIKSSVAGIAMGLIKEGDQVAVLTDILGDEDHMGDMDFKVAGTRQGITGFQMDIKIKGISTAIMQEALEKAKRARFHVLDKMDQALAAPRENLSQFAPRILTIKIPTDMIGMVIGPGGKMIREITERTGATINIDDDGTVTIASVDSQAGSSALDIIRKMTAEAKEGEIYTGKIKSIKPFGAFVEILPGKEGLLHISQMDVKRVARVEDLFKVGDEVQVKLLKIDKEGRYELSRKVLLET